MIRIKDQKQNDLFDLWSFMSPKRLLLLDQSWAGLFKKELLCELPVGKVAPFFNDDFGRPTKELLLTSSGIMRSISPRSRIQPNICVLRPYGIACSKRQSVPSAMVVPG